MRREDELGAIGVRLGILEQLEQARRQSRVKTRVDLIKEEDPATSKGVQRRPDEGEPGLGARRLLVKIKGQFLS